MNKTSVLRFIGAVFFFLVLSFPAYALTPGQVFKKVKDSVVVVKTLDATGNLKGQGSGVIISSGKVATNCHVVEGSASYKVGRGKQLVSATLYAEDEEKDICILVVRSLNGKSVQIGKAANLKVGDPVYAVGAPRGLELSLSDGIVAQLRGGPTPFIQTTAAISPGSSGGGLFDKEGRLVGLTTLYLEGGQSLNFAMPVEWIGEVKPFLKKVAKGTSHAKWIKRSLALEQIKNWQGLHDWCSKWTEKNPESAIAWYGLGVAYEQLNLFNEAIEAFRQVLRINPEEVMAWHGLAWNYVRLERYDDAIEAYRQALRVNPEYADAWYNLGVTYGDLERYNDAIEAYRQALRVNPEEAEAWGGLGVAYAKLDRLNDAIEAFRQVLRINQQNVDAWYNLGVAYAKLDRLNDAIEAFRQVLRINQQNVDAWYNLGLIYHNTGNQKAARDSFQKLQRLDPERAVRLFNQIDTH